METDGCPVTILVADDEPQVLELVVELLSQKGYHVLAASDAEEALRVAGAHPGAVDLLLTDIVMPGMSGTELAQHLCAARPGLRVTYMSGYAGTKTDRTRFLKEDEVLLPKPFSAGQLLSTVRAALEAPK